MDYVINELIRVMRHLESTAKEMPAAEIDNEAIKKGIELSERVTRQPKDVVATPVMKNLMIILGDIKYIRSKDGTIKHTRFRAGMKSKAVAWINMVVYAALRKYNGVEKHDYNESIPIDSIELYNIDCWNGWKKELWDIQPGQEKQVFDGYGVFEDPRTNMTVEQAIYKLQHDRPLQEATIALIDELPRVEASREVRVINDPFLSKGSGVSYPDYSNDRTIKEGELTYGEYEVQLASEAAKGGITGLRKFALKNNVYTGYARWQRGSGRPLIAQSRRTNLVVNCVDGPEMERWKETECLRAAFVDEEQLAEILFELGDWVLAHPGADAANLDYSKWDRNLGGGWILYQDAVRYLKAADDYTRKLIEIRYRCNRDAYFVDGRRKALKRIYGRMTSGYMDTTLGNSTANRGLTRRTACKLCRSQITKYTKPLHGKDLLVVGDDVLLISDKGFITKFAKESNKFAGTIMHEDEKHARGIMFIQYRAFRDEGKWVMAYNWPRVLRSMLSKENAKNLGRAGWTLAYYQQLGKLRRAPKFCAIVLNTIAALDQYHLSLDIPVNKLIKMANMEDAQRVKSGVANRKAKMKKSNTTAEKLFNSNPNIPGVKEVNGKLEIDANYFMKLQGELKSLYDPNFLPHELGIPNPDLSKISAQSS